MKKLLLTIAALITISGCSSPTDMTEKKEAKAIYWHENGRYTAAIATGNGIVMHSIPFYGNYSDAMRVIADVEARENLWYRCEWVYSYWLGNRNGACEIHLHDIDSLGTADWNHGKFGVGATTRIDKQN